MAENKQTRRKNALINWLVKSGNSIQDENITGRNDKAEVEVTNRYISGEEILKILVGIEWNKSMIPKEYIKENQFCESTGSIVVTLTEESSFDSEPNIQQINRYLLQLAYLFSGAVRNGAQLAAIASRAGMMNALSIRREIITAQKIFPETFEKYMQSCIKFMDCYVLYTNVSGRIDSMQDIVNDYKNSLDEKEIQYQQTLRGIAEYVKTDSELRSELAKFHDQTYNQSSGLWSRKLYELYQTMVNLRIQQFNMKYEMFLLKTEEKKFHEISAVREQLRSTLNGSKPSPEMDILQNMESVYMDVLDKSRKSEIEYAQLLRKMEQVGCIIDRMQG